MAGKNDRKFFLPFFKKLNYRVVREPDPSVHVIWWRLKNEGFFEAQKLVEANGKKNEI